LVDFTEDELRKQLLEFAEQLAKGASVNIYADLEQTTAEVGNVVDAEGQPLSEELILRAFEKMEHTFEPDGMWHPPTILAHPTAIDRLIRNSNSHGSSKAFNQALTKILDKKRDDFRRREADRVLAG
jgi:hypothetical protein